MLVYPNVTLSSVANSNPVLIPSAGMRIENRLSSTTIVSLGLICTLSAGASLTYSVQVSADPPTLPIVNWNNHDTLVNLTTSANGNIAYPITAYRLVVTVYGSGSVTLGVAQWP